MPHILSKLSTGVDYATYKKLPGGKMGIESVISIKGKADVTDPKTLVMPNGVATYISEEELALLEKHPVFILHKENGHISVSKTDNKHEAAEQAEKAKDLEADASKQQTEADFKKKQKKAPKTKKD